MTVRDRKQVHEFGEAMQVRELLRRLDLLPNTVLVVRNGEVVTEDEVLRELDEVRIVRVISGGAAPLRACGRRLRAPSGGDTLKGRQR